MPKNKKNIVKIWYTSNKIEQFNEINLQSSLYCYFAPEALKFKELTQYLTPGAPKSILMTDEIC